MIDETDEVKRRYWLSVIKECNASGEKKDIWLKEHNISRTNYYKWQKLIRSDVANQLITAEPETVTPSFVELTEPITDTGTVTIKSNGISLELNESISDVFLIRIMKAIRNA